MIALLIAFGLVTASHLVQARIGLGLADEGYLWNGVARTARGRIPIRDFDAYDPGRYYWTLAWTAVLGRGILGIRRAAALCQVLGLWVGLLSIERVADHPLLWVAYGVLVVWWMQPRHKVYEHAASLGAVYAGLRLLEDTGSLTVFGAGVFVGLAAFVGRNHGLYAFLALGTLVLLARPPEDAARTLARLSVWGGGVAVGYAPMWLMFLSVRRMFRRFVDEMVVVFWRRGTANLPLPVPWPWRAPPPGLRRRDRWAHQALGWFFLLLPGGYIAAAGALIAGVVPSPAAPLLTAATVVGMCYLHHALSRADLSHLCQSMQPFLLGVWAVACASSIPTLGLVLVGGLVVLSGVAVRPLVPILIWWESRHAFVETAAAGDRLWLPVGEARFLESLRSWAAHALAPAEPIYVAPTAATLYRVLDRDTPVRSDFPVFPGTPSGQAADIADLERLCVRWAVLKDEPLDGREELRFRNAHPDLWRYLATHFEPQVVAGIAPPWSVLRRADTPTPQDGAPHGQAPPGDAARPGGRGR